MSVELKNPNECPPGQFRYRIPELQGEVAWVKGYWNYNDLEKEVLRRYKANSITAPSDLRNQIMTQLCEQLPPDRCTDTDRIRSWGRDLARAFDRVMQGTSTLLDWLVRGNREQVPDEEASRRAAICATCIFNADPEGCSQCNMKALRSLADAIVGGNRQPWDAQLKSCGICGCTLSAKVRLPLDVLRRHLKPEQLTQLPPAYPGFAGCWLREEVVDAQQ